VPRNARFFARFTLSLAFRYSVTFIVRLQNFRNTPHRSVCLRSSTYLFGLLDVRGRSLRHHWRRGVARRILPLWNWDGYPESGCAIHRAQDLVGGSCATVKSFGLTNALGEWSWREPSDMDMQPERVSSRERANHRVPPILRSSRAIFPSSFRSLPATGEFRLVIVSRAIRFLRFFHSIAPWRSRL
jgi:hypothetical protein